MLKRLFDILFSTVVLVALGPVLMFTALLIFLQDFHSPFYVAPRVGLRARVFSMVKFRSMVVNADRTGVTSTSSADSRITRIGHAVRSYKLDELPQFWNVLKGDMSVVGPRPNVDSGVALYSLAERGLLEIRPGITDIASIVFSDEGEILKGHADPDVTYNLVIRPWKSKLGLLYRSRSSLALDAQLVWLTFVAVISRPRALKLVSELVGQLGGDAELVAIAGRTISLSASVSG